MTVCRGIRGATTVEEDTREAVLSATRELLIQMIEANDIHPDDVASVIFTTTPDLTSEYPALAARQLGWHDVALLCAHEMAVPYGLKRCIRVLLHWNTDKLASEIQHIYIKGAVNLRPDRAAIELSSQSGEILTPVDTAQDGQPGNGQMEKRRETVSSVTGADSWVWNARVFHRRLPLLQIIPMWPSISMPPPVSAVPVACVPAASCRATM